MKRKEMIKKFVFRLLTRPKSPVFPALMTESLVFSSSLLNDEREERRSWWLFFRQWPTHIDQRKWNIGQWKQFLTDLSVRVGKAIEYSSWLDGSGKIAWLFLYLPTFHHARNDMRNTFDLWHSGWNWLDSTQTTLQQQIVRWMKPQKGNFIPLISSKKSNSANYIYSRRLKLNFLHSTTSSGAWTTEARSTQCWINSESFHSFSLFASISLLLERFSYFSRFLFRNSLKRNKNFIYAQSSEKMENFQFWLAVQWSTGCSRQKKVFTFQWTFLR